MPGGKNYRQWYAMRAKLIAEGKWKGKVPSHFVPQFEEGEPRPKQPLRGSLFERAADSTPETSPNSEVPPSQADTIPETPPSTPDSLPPLESPETEEGIHEFRRIFCNSICKRRLYINTRFEFRRKRSKRTRTIRRCAGFVGFSMVPRL